MWAASEATRAYGHLDALSSASQERQHNDPQWRASLDELRWGKRRVRDALLQEWRGEEVDCPNLLQAASHACHGPESALRLAPAALPPCPLNNLHHEKQR